MPLQTWDEHKENRRAASAAEKWGLPCLAAFWILASLAVLLKGWF